MQPDLLLHFDPALHIHLPESFFLSVLMVLPSVPIPTHFFFLLYPAANYRSSRNLQPSFLPDPSSYPSPTPTTDLVSAHGFKCSLFTYDKHIFISSPDFSSKLWPHKYNYLTNIHIWVSDWHCKANISKRDSKFPFNNIHLLVMCIVEKKDLRTPVVLQKLLWKHLGSINHSTKLYYRHWAERWTPRRMKWDFDHQGTQHSK